MRLIISHADYEDVTNKSARELLKDDVFHRVLVEGDKAKKDSHSTLYGEDETEAHQNKVKTGWKG